MRAILLAAGLGTRLRPITDAMPKCLVPIRGRPLLDYWLEVLARQGEEKILINTHYLADQVKKFVLRNKYRDSLIISHEPDLLGTAGTLLANSDFFAGQDGLLIHADNYCSPDIRSFIAAHERRPDGCLMTMMTFFTDDPSSCGIVEIDDRGVVVGFHEKVKAPPGNLANGAVYAISSDLLEMMKAKFSSARDFSTEILPSLLGKIFTHHTEGPFWDVGTPDSYKKACRHRAESDEHARGVM